MRVFIFLVLALSSFKVEAALRDFAPLTVEDIRIDVKLKKIETTRGTIEYQELVGTAVKGEAAGKTIWIFKPPLPPRPKPEASPTSLSVGLKSLSASGNALAVEYTTEWMSPPVSRFVIDANTGKIVFKSAPPNMWQRFLGFFGL